MNLLEILERNLQQYLTIMINKKIIRQGIFVLFSLNNYYINLIIKNNKGENKVFEFPYPFKATQTDKKIVLSYKNKEITGNDPEILKIIKHHTKLKNSKLLDNEIVFLVGNTLK